MNDAPVPARRPRRAWIAFEPEEVIELKQAMLDYDVPGAVAFFQRVVVPTVRAAARRCGILLDEDKEGHDGCLSG